MPICPRCSSSIHSGAEDQCPACGYGMARADALFGEQDIEFTRVVDEAGALTHRERVELLGYLANLERRVAPVVLCVYITDHGQLREFRPHAHWALNHARIHHPSFGKREQMVTIETAELRERKPGEERPPVEEEVEPGLFSGLWQNFCGRCRDLCLPCPPPVRQDWILMLVLDVQLEVACFSWGYMLDPYVLPDKINSCIVGSRLQFRERAMVTALRRVMADAVGQLARNGRKVNRELRRKAGLRFNMLPPLMAAGAAVALSASPLVQAQEAAAEPQPPAETQPAEAPPAEAPAEAPPAEAPPAPPVVPGVAAAYNAEPKWSSVDYVHLMSGRLPEGYNLLMPGRKQKTDSAPERPAPARRNSKAETESDTKVPGRYCKLYLDPRGTVLRDPQMLLSDVERGDVAHVLRELNAHSRFHLFVSVFVNGQEVPRELASTNLVTHVAQPGQYAAVLQFGVGEPATVELGYKEIKPTDEQAREWLETVRRSVAAAGGGTEGLLAGIRSLHACIRPLEKDFTPLTPETAGTVRKIELPIKPEEKEKEVTWKERAQAWIEAGHATPYAILAGAGLVLLGLGGWLFYWHRSCCRLIDTEPDYRLASRYGAGVSRYVRYLEGKEVKKEKSPV